MTRLFWIGGAVVAVIMLALAGYEIVRVAQARAQTPDLFMDIIAIIDPDIIDVPPARIDMLLAVEDPTFWTNDGTDTTTPGAGSATLTQSLARQIYFPHGFQPGFQSIELWLISRYAVNHLVSKHATLRAAMSQAYFSHDDRGTVTGFAEAARRFYGRPLSVLSDDQYLSLVAMLYAPDAMNPKTHPAQNAERVKRIKRLLAKACTPTGPDDTELKGCAA